MRPALCRTLLAPRAFSDNFARPDGPIGRAASGRPWLQVPANGASRVLSVIEGSKLVTPNRPDVGTGATAGYSIIANRRNVQEMGARISWTAGANNASLGLIITRTPPGADANYITIDGAIHAIYSPASMVVGFYFNNALSNLTTFNYTDIPKDGSQHDLSFKLLGDTMMIFGPYGETTTRTDSRFIEYAGAYATFEAFWSVSPADCRTVIHRIWGR